VCVGLIESGGEGCIIEHFVRRLEIVIITPI
jgi:hypothetical protein